MGNIYRKTVTRAAPPDAEIIGAIARWIDDEGKTRTAPVNAAGRVVVKAKTFTARYRDGSGRLREFATGCRDKTAAKRILSDLEQRAAKVKAKILTPAEDIMSVHQDTLLVDHFAAYVAYLATPEAECTSPVHRENVRRSLSRIANDCGFNKLADVTSDSFSGWLERKAAAKMSARTRNGYRSALVAFCNWCVKTGKLTANPIAVRLADEKSDPRRKRRALTEAELIKLPDVARRRPLLDAMTVRRGKHKGKAVADVRPEVAERLRELGRERALIYKTLFLTGLRKGELASLTAGQLQLDGPIAVAELEAADEKNREGSTIPLRAELAADLAAWIADKRTRGDVLPINPVADEPLFNVPAGLIRILDRDLKLAGIPKRDSRGRTIDVHALRTSFGTHLSKGGVTPRTAQAAMRHSTIDLTMNTYTDPRLLDVHGALDSLPALPLGAEPQSARATGTDGKCTNAINSVVSDVALDSARRGDLLARTVRMAVEGNPTIDATERDLTPESGDSCDNLATPVTHRHQKRAKGLEPSTSSLGS